MNFLRKLFTLRATEILPHNVECLLVKHIIEITEPLDHTEGDDGGKIKYKLIFGDKSQKE